MFIVKVKKLFLILLIGFSIQLIYVIRHSHTSWLQGMTHGLQARNILLGRGLSTGTKESRELTRLQNEKRCLIDISEVPVFQNDTYTPFAWHMCGDAYILAAIWKITGDYRFIYMQIIQLLLSTLMIFLMFRIVKELFSEQLALFSTLLYALYPPRIFLNTVPLCDGWIIFVTILLVYLIISYRNKPNFIETIMIGAISPLGAYFRPAVLFLTPVSLLLSTSYLGKNNVVKLLVSYFISVIVILSPWWLRNYKLYQKYILLTPQLGTVLWTGLGILPNKYGFRHSDEAADRYVKESGYNYPYGSPEFNHVLFKRGVEVILKDPIYWLKVVLYRIPIAFFNTIPWGIFEPKDFEYCKEWSYTMWYRETGKGLIDYAKNNILIFIYKLAQRVLISILFFFAIIGIWLKRKETTSVLLLVSVPLYFVLFHLFINMDARYVLPGTWVYFIFAGVSIDRFIKKILPQKNGQIFDKKI